MAATPERVTRQGPGGEGNVGMPHLGVVTDAGEGAQRGHEREQMHGGSPPFPDRLILPNGTFVVPPPCAWRKDAGTLAPVSTGACKTGHAYLTESKKTKYTLKGNSLFSR